MQFRVLGPIEVDAGDGPIALGGPKQRAVLATLLVRANQVVPAETLIDEVWGDEPPEKARNTLQTYVSSLRRSLGEDRLLGRPPGYLLIVDPGELDAARFDALVREAGAAAAVDPGVAVATFEDALALWRGPALADVADRPSLLAEAARLDEMRLGAQEQRLEGLLAHGEQARAIGELEALLAHHPMRERLWELLIVALYRDGRQADALAAFQRAREVLADELGIDPSPSLAALHERVLRQDPDLELRGEALRGYRLLEKIGEGPHATVFRAIQPHVGRDVAVKLFHERIADEPAFVRGFDPRAQAAAALEHPHVVPVYDAWREPGRACVVSRLMRGGSLAAMQARGEPPDRAWARRIVEQVGTALASIHRQDLVHGAVTASNVLFDAEGNAYLADLSVISPSATDPAADRAALAELARMLLGEDASEPDPADAEDTVPKAAAAIRNPYKGLRPFTETDAADFFGRTQLVRSLVAGLGAAEGRFLAVVGPSGSGKSSVVRAGVVPAVRRGEIDHATEGPTTVVEMFPGVHPFDELAEALVRIAPTTLPRLADLLASGSRGLLRGIEQAVPDGELVLVIDQFEEVFTLTTDERERERFLEALRVAVADPESQLRVVVTLRADFYDRPLAHPRFAELLAAGTVAIAPLTPDELEQAIRLPAARMDVQTEPGLVAEMIADVIHQPGALPLLQFALTELFERRDGASLTLEAYQQIGQVAGALSTRAERLLADADHLQGRAIRQVFLRLVTLGEGREDTRRRVPLDALDDLEVDRDAVAWVLETFGRHRLLTFDREPATRQPTVEIAHEALLSAWWRLAAWIDTAREDLRREAELGRAAAAWHAAEEDPSFLLSGTRLDQTVEWIGGTDLAIARPSLAYVKASAEERHRGDAAEAERAAHEAATERRARTRLRALVAVFAIAALVAGSLTLIATDQSGRAEREAAIAAIRELTAGAVAATDTDPELSVLLAMEAVERSRPLGGPVYQQAVTALHDAVGGWRLIEAIPDAGGHLAWSPEGVFVAQDLHHPGDLVVRDVRSGDVVAAVPAHRGKLTDLALNVDGSFLATIGSDGALIVWEMVGGILVSDGRISEPAT